MSDQAFEFTGIFYAASEDDMWRILSAIAEIVCATGGTAVAKPVNEDDDESTSDGGVT